MSRMLQMASAWTRPALGIPMAEPTRLRRRLAHLATTPGAARCVLGGPTRGIIVLLVLAAVGLLGSVRLARSAGAQPLPAAAAQPPAPDAPKPPEPAQPSAVPELPEAQPAQPPPQDQVVDVAVIKPRREAWARFLRSPCTLKVLNPSPVHARVAGVLTAKRLAAVGDRVKKGDVLAEIEAIDLPVQLDKARALVRQATTREKQSLAAVSIARATVEGARTRIDEVKLAVQQARDNLQAAGLATRRAKTPDEQETAREKFAAAEREVAAAEIQLKSAQAALSKATAEEQAAEAGAEAAQADRAEAEAEVQRIQGRFDLTKVISPIDGVVFKRSLEPGDPIRPDQTPPLFLVARSDVLTTSVLIPESLALLAAVGQPAAIELADATRFLVFPTKVRRIGTEIVDGDLRVDIEIPNPGGRLFSGASATAVIRLEEPREAITVPVNVLCWPQPELPAPTNSPEFNAKSDEARCFRISGGRSVVTPVKLGLSDGWRVEVLSGLKGDEILIADAVSGGKPTKGPVSDFDSRFKHGPRVHVVDLPPARAPRDDFYRERVVPREVGSGLGGPTAEFP